MSLETVILGMGAAYAIIEAVQLILLIHQTKRTADTLERLMDPESETAGRIAENFFLGMSRRIRESPEAQAEFGNFVAWMGACAVSTAKTEMQKAMKPPKMKSIGDILGAVFQFPGVQQAVERKASKLVGGAVEEGAEAVVESVFQV